LVVTKSFASRFGFSHAGSGTAHRTWWSEDTGKWPPRNLFYTLPMVDTVPIARPADGGGRSPTGAMYEGLRYDG
jgi:hypothetical protein